MLPALRARYTSMVLKRYVGLSTTIHCQKKIPVSKIQLKPPEGVEGYFKYSRNLSRDPKWNGYVPQGGDTPFTFLTRRLGHAYEIYPLFFLVAFWISICAYTTYWSFNKVEVWLDRSQNTPPWDWERIKNNYWKKPTVIFDPDGRTHKRLEIMETLQNELVEAAKARGTR